ncbi:AMP-binding protein [Caldinitratiruptor microaerophilus]|uniref:Acyl-CoA synthetase n=1 Tax=Caldinitratiruptor microaerophilus TaxID=671077 RepID=A0AA35CIJ8_9FIRM|nr:AMP-binding protein [Caldinitratiruptor microaerophilus]BDG59820.1 acyl-CoA synthetase [Caldinitratiruptor microaerophilus]
MPTGLEMNLLRRFNVGDILRRSALRTPDRPALRFGGRNISYADLDGMANRVGNAFRARGVQPGDVVAVLALNSPEFVATWFGLARIGAVLLPVNAMLRGPEISAILRRARVRGLIVEEVLHPLVQTEAETLASVPFRFWLPSGQAADPPSGWESYPAVLNEAAPEFPEVQVENEAPATLLFTSGTESAPKGVVNTHLNWYAALLSALADLELNRRHRPLLALPLFHVAGLYLLLGTLATGATGVLLRRIDGAEVVSAIESEQVTYLVLPATAYAGLLRLPDLERRNLGSLRRCVVFQYLPGEALDRWLQLVPQAEWVGYWGQSELTPLGASTPPEELREHRSRPDPIGRAHLPLEVRLVDGDDRPVPPGQVGELVVRGPAVMAGYFDDPERTAQAFRGGWHHTGDLAVADEDGFLYFVDRLKDIVKTGGENVSSQEVEEVIARHPAVAEVSVIGIPDPYWVEAVAAVVVRRGPVTEEDIIQHCRAHLASFKVPKQVFFVEDLPRSPSGKILKRELKQKYGGKA